MIYEFIKPMFGFEDLREVELSDIDDYFAKLISTQNNELSFTLINPYMLREYDITLPRYVKELLDVGDDTTVDIRTIMIVHTPVEESTINFIAPIVFNKDNNKCMQIVLDGAKYPEFNISETLKAYMS